MLNPQSVLADIVRLAKGKKLWLAYSGGVDSHVLLHLLATSNARELTDLDVVYIDHGLQSESTKWAQHCATVCATLKVNFQCLTVDVTGIADLGLEAAARKARYDGIATLVGPEDVVLTAQHQHDQAETLLLQLLRGAGPKGLSAMATESQLNTVTLIRPLLAVAQADIIAYAKQHKLQWMEDPSNVETRWNRNYIRHDLWPLIEQRWPSAAKTLSRSAQHCAEASELMIELAQQDLPLLLTQKNSLSISSLLLLSPARQRNVLRYYIESQNYVLPSTTNLQRIIVEVCLAAADKTPLVTWKGVEVRRYQDALYLMSPLSRHESAEITECHGLEPISLATSDTLTWQIVIGEGLSSKTLSCRLTVHFRCGGEQIVLAGQQQHKSLKHLFQQWQVPTWQRDRIPLIFCEDVLVAVVGYGYANDYVATEQEQGFIPSLIKQ
jgi:tRNA(Ile)-lysidine synthase